MIFANKPRAPAKMGKRKNDQWLMMRRNKALYLFILPAFLYFFIFSYIPMYGVQIAFKDFIASRGFGGSPWAHPLAFEYAVNCNVSGLQACHTYWPVIMRRHNIGTK